jgi:hypothetical protein
MLKPAYKTKFKKDLALMKKRGKNSRNYGSIDSEKAARS